MTTFSPDSRAILRTSMGAMTIEFLPRQAPRTCEHFVRLVRRGYYDGLTFHRIIKGFMVQGGCPKGDGTGGPGQTIRAEFNETPHVKGVISMARGNDPHSAGSQFFIVHGDARYLDSRYTAFARVVDGLDVLDRIAAVPVEENRFRERSVPREPVFINGIELEGIEFDANDQPQHDQGRQQGPPQQQGHGNGGGGGGGNAGGGNAGGGNAGGSNAGGGGQPRDQRDQRDPRDQREPREPREPRETRDSREPRENRDTREPRENRETREPRENRDSRNQPREVREVREPREPREVRESEDVPSPAAAFLAESRGSKRRGDAPRAAAPVEAKGHDDEDLGDEPADDRDAGPETGSDADTEASGDTSARKSGASPAAPRKPRSRRAPRRKPKE